MAFKVNGTTVIDNNRQLLNITDADEGTAVAINSALPISPAIDFIPNWSSPDLTVVGTSTWNKPSGMPDDASIIAYMITRGAPGNYDEYSTNWGFGGRGGIASLLFINAGNLDGATLYAESSQRGTTLGWQGGTTVENDCYITLSGGAQYYASNGTTYKAWSAPTNPYPLNGVSTSDFYASCTGGVITVSSPTYNLQGSGIGATDVGRSYGEPYPAFAGGNGQANYSTLGQLQPSIYGGNGGPLNYPGEAPGGGGGGWNNQGVTPKGTNKGAPASIRLYYATTYIP